MKKLFTFLFFSLWIAATVSAQSNETGYAFADKDGNVFTAEELICNDVEDDGFGSVQVPSNLYIKNVSGEEGTSVAIQANITKIDNGDVQLCFPVNCASYHNLGEQNVTEKAELAIGEVKSLQTEWFPVSEGECIVVYTAIVYKGIIKKGTFSITVKYQNGTAGISATQVDSQWSKPIYDLAGRQLTKMHRGLNIVRMADGTVRKVRII